MRVKIRKKIIRCISLILLLFLIICTVIATRNQRMQLPRVVITVPQAGRVNGQEYDWVIPVSALHQEGDSWYGYDVDTVDGLFEEEQIVHDIRFIVLDMDESYAAVKKKPFDLNIITDSSQPLKDGMRVTEAGAGGLQ